MLVRRELWRSSSPSERRSTANTRIRSPSFLTSFMNFQGWRFYYTFGYHSADHSVLVLLYCLSGEYFFKYPEYLESEYPKPWHAVISPYNITCHWWKAPGSIILRIVHHPPVGCSQIPTLKLLYSGLSFTQYLLLGCTTHLLILLMFLIPCCWALVSFSTPLLH